MGSAEPFKFSSSQFFDDIQKTASSIGAPFSESVTRTVLNTYAEQWNKGSICMRTTNQAESRLWYRFFLKEKSNVFELAEAEGLIKKGDVLSDLIASWSSLYGGLPEASCDFEASKGLSKLWMFFGAKRPLDEILQAPAVPDAIRRNGPLLHSLGLNVVQHTAVDYHRRSVNFYFDYFGETTMDRAITLTKLANAAPPNQAQLEQMNKYLTPDGHPFAVTMTLDGVIRRVCFYAIRTITQSAEEVDPRISAFWAVAPSYDERDYKGISWSFGGDAYMKTEQGYCGDVLAMGEYWDTDPPATSAPIAV